MSLACPTHKVRFRVHREAVSALHAAHNSRETATALGVTTRLRECRTYPCSICSGWHLTSQEA